VQLDLLTVHRMIGQLVDDMRKKRDNFQVCRDSTAKFVQCTNDQPDRLNETDLDLVVKESLPVRRQRRGKCMVGELSIGEISSASDPVRKNRIELYNLIVDTILSSIKQWVDRTSSILYADLSLRHLRNFVQAPAGAMGELCKCLLRFDDSITTG